MSQVVLITGCSTGIGRDLVQRLASAGYQVVATARNVGTLEGLPAALTLPLDVTEQDSIDQAVECTLQRFGRIDVLVNNAGYALRGALEEVPVEQAQKMFDVNVFGVMRLVQAVAPHMRQQGGGRIVNLSSIAGRLSTPVNGAYSATKFAVEALSDALRHELAPFGIQVVLIEPASIKTHFLETAEAQTQGTCANPASPYRALYRQSEQFSAGMTRVAPGPEAVSRVIQGAIEAARPKARYLVAVDLPGRLVLHLGHAAWDLVLKRMFKVGQEAES